MTHEEFNEKLKELVRECPDDLNVITVTRSLNQGFGCQGITCASSRNGDDMTVMLMLDAMGHPYREAAENLMTHWLKVQQAVNKR